MDYYIAGHIGDAGRLRYIGLICGRGNCSYFRSEFFYLHALNQGLGHNADHRPVFYTIFY